MQAHLGASLSRYDIYTLMFLTRARGSMVLSSCLLGNPGRVCGSREGAVRPAWRLPSHAKRKFNAWACLTTDNNQPARVCTAQGSVSTAGGSSPPIDVLVMVEATTKQVKCVAAESELILPSYQRYLPQCSLLKSRGVNFRIVLTAGSQNLICALPAAA